MHFKAFTSFYFATSCKYTQQLKIKEIKIQKKKGNYTLTRYLCL